MYHSEMKANAGEHPGKSNTDTIVQENQINAKELTESIKTEIPSNSIKKATQSTQVENASDKKIVALSTDQVDPCKTQLLQIKSELNPTKNEFKDDIQKEKEHEMKTNEPIEIDQHVIPPPLSLEHPESDSNDCERDLKTDIDTCTVTPTTTSTTTTTSTSTATSTSTSTTPSTIEKNQLPIEKHKKDILEQIGRDRVTIVQGGTGCGKSSRLPEMLLEDSRIHGRKCLIMVRHLCPSAFYYYFLI
jgi:hypothetical protein